MDILRTIARANGLMLQGDAQGAESVLDEAIVGVRQLMAERDELRAYKEAAEKQKPVAWGAFYFGGKYRGQLYSHDSTEEKIDDYIAYVHRSNDSITLQKGPLFTNPVPADKPAVAVPDGFREIVEAVAHIGVDFGYGNFALSQEHIEKARELLAAAHRAREDRR